MAQDAYSGAAQESMQGSPFPRVCMHTPDPERPQSQCPDRAELVETAARRLPVARPCLTKAHQVHRKRLGRKRQLAIPNAGDLVLVSSRLTQQQEKGERKLGQRWFGPSGIIKSTGGVGYVVDCPSSMRLHCAVNMCSWAGVACPPATRACSPEKETPTAAALPQALADRGGNAVG